MSLKFRSLLTVTAMSGLLFTACNNESASEKKSDTAATTESTPPPPPPQEAEKGVMVGGANMVPSKDIVDNAANSNEHKTLVAAVQAAGLAETLKGAGPFTVFAPTDAAFGKLPAGTVDNLLKAEKKADLTKILTFHVVQGAFKSSDLKDGQKVKTVQGGELTINYKDDKWSVTDAKGGTVNITIPDVISSNGVTYVVDGVLMPK